MSETSAPFGFRPSFHQSGQIRAKRYVVDVSSYTTPIYHGDPVKLTDEGTIQLGTSDGSRAGTFAGVLLLGIAQGFEYIDATGKPVVDNWYPGNVTSGTVYAWVLDDPETVFEAQYTNPSPGTTVQTAVGEQCDWSVLTPVTTGRSISQLGAIEGSGTGQFQIVGFSPRIEDSLTDTYVVAQVRINEHQFRAAAASI